FGRMTFMLILLLAIIFLFSCNEDSNPVDNNPTIASSTKKITPESGGSIELINKSGDQIKLTIYPYSLEDTTNITLEILNDVAENPFSQNILTTIRILPDGLKLDSAATIKVTFNKDISDTSKTILYYRKENNLAHPLKSKWINNRTVEAFIFHFSDYGGAIPTSNEIISQTQNTSQEPNSNVWDWQSFYDLITALLKYEAMLELIGETDLSEQLHNKIVQKVTEQVNLFMNQPIPDEPCGYYLKTFLKYHEMAILIGVDEHIVEQMNEKLNEVLNRCYVRGELEFDYQYCVAAEGAEICRTITGFVPFTVNTTVEPHGQINGSGNLDWSGTMTGLPPNCIYNETGVVSVTLGGEMVIDEFGVLWLDFEISEHASGTVTAGCDGINQTYPFNPPDVTHNIRILAQEGSELIMPIPGANGNFRWIVHLNFLPCGINKKDFVKNKF
ncbi:MAG: hypothetical protein ACK4UV_08500, partial [Ignavibacterium sp.]